jgi:hypothetical protein
VSLYVIDFTCALDFGEAQRLPFFDKAYIIFAVSVKAFVIAPQTMVLITGSTTSKSEENPAL